MSTHRQRNAAAAKLGMFFLELGYIPTMAEYKVMSGVPLRLATIRTYYKNWARMLVVMERAQPQLWAELQKLSEPKVVEKEPKKVEKEPTKPVTKTQKKVVAAKDK